MPTTMRDNRDEARGMGLTVVRSGREMSSKRGGSIDMALLALLFGAGSQKPLAAMRQRCNAIIRDAKRTGAERR
jgi:hypothetical protein